MNKNVLSLFVLAVTTSVTAQNTFRKNDVYFELLGNGIAASINYERLLMNKPGLGVRIGAGYFSGDENFRISIPVAVNYLFNLRKNKSFLDAGIGGTWSGSAGLQTPKQEAAAGGRSYKEHILSLVPSVSFRHHTKGNFMWRASFTPIINKYKAMPWIGLSFGKRL